MRGRIIYRTGGWTFDRVRDEKVHLIGALGWVAPARQAVQRRVTCRSAPRPSSRRTVGGPTARHITRRDARGHHEIAGGGSLRRLASSPDESRLALAARQQLVLKLRRMVSRFASEQAGSDSSMLTGRVKDRLRASARAVRDGARALLPVARRRRQTRCGGPATWHS